MIVLLLHDRPMADISAWGDKVFIVATNPNCDPRALLMGSEQPNIRAVLVEALAIVVNSSELAPQSRTTNLGTAAAKRRR